jgi:vitamin B12 transporter
MTFVSCAAARVRARRFHLLATTILVSALAPSGWTAASAQNASLPELPTIVVSPTTVPTPVDRIASSVTVITAADIEREQKRTVPDVLQTVPGLNVVQTGGPGGTTSVFMRGTEARHVKVLIDGIDIGDPSDSTGAADISQLLAGDIERIEVLRGAQSGLYGSDAIGGVISITTRKGQGPAKATASLEGGSFGTLNQTARVSGSQDKFNYAFNVVHLRATATPSVPDRFVSPGSQGIDNYYDNKTISSRLGYDFNDALSVNWTGRYTDAAYHYPDDYVTVQENAVSHQFLTRGEAVWSALDGRVKSFFGVNYTDLYRWNTNLGWYSPPTTYKGERIKYDWRSVVQVMPGQTLVVGADDQTDYYKNDNTSAINGRVDVQNGNKGAYVELQSEFAERFFVVSNVRHDENDAFGGHDTFRIAPAVLLPTTDTKLKASYGTGFKAPSLDQLYGAYDYGYGTPTYGNPNLKPEESKGWDAGFEQPIAGDRVRFGATYFHNDITNLIQFTNMGTYYTNTNVAEAKTWGVETFASWSMTSRFKLRGDYTYTKATNETTGVDLQRRPNHKGSVTANWNPIDPLTLSATVLHVGSWYDNYDRSNTATDPHVSGYTVVNLAGEYKTSQNTTIFGRIDNLFDKHYENPLGYAKPGIGVFGGVRVATQ